MATLQKISHGEPNWDVKVNRIIDQLTAQGDLKWIQSSEGLVVQSGFVPNTVDANTYRYLQIGNAKIVDVNFGVKMPTDIGNSSMLTAVKLPESLSANLYTEYAENDKYQLTLSGTDFRIARMQAATDWWFGEGSHYLAHFVYVHMD